MIRLLLATITVSSLFNFSVHAGNIKNKKCTPDQPLAVIYLNGVNNSEEIDVYNSQNSILDIMSKKINLGGLHFSKVCRSYVYNQTIGLKLPGDKYIPLGDAIETIAQKIVEEKAKRNLGINWEKFARYIATNDTTHIFEGLLEEGVNNIQNVILTAFKFSHDAKYHAETVQKISTEMKNFVEYQKEGETELRPVVVVSHSQGNLFFNTIYDKFINENLLPNDYLENHFGNLQVGSAALSSNSQISDYFTAANDHVIQSVLDLGFEVRPPNFYILFNSKDPSMNHSFVDTYTNNTVGTFYKDVYDRFNAAGEVVSSDLDKIFFTQNIFYEKLNALAEQVLREPEPIVLNTSKLCLDDNKVDFQIGVSDNFISIELGSVILNETGLEISRTVTKKYEKLSELPNPIISEKTKMAHFDHTHSSRAHNEQFFVKACTVSNCDEKMFPVGKPIFEMNLDETDAFLKDAQGANIRRVENTVKFQAFGDPGLVKSFPASGPYCYVFSGPYCSTGVAQTRVVGAVSFNDTTQDTVRTTVTHAEETVEIKFIEDGIQSCSNPTEHIAALITVVKPSCLGEFAKAAEVNEILGCFE